MLMWSAEDFVLSVVLIICPYFRHAKTKNAGKSRILCILNGDWNLKCLVYTTETMLYTS